MTLEQRYGFSPYRDWTELARSWLTEAGYETPPCATEDEVARLWLNVRHRSVEPVPRRSYRASDFEVPQEDIPAVSEIERRIVAGLDVNRFLSKRLLDAAFQDHLLFDWGIHHFHLNIALDSSGFSIRSGRLLFVRFAAASAYLIAVGDHKSWTDERMIEVLHRDWPDSISNLRLVGLHGPTEQISPADRSRLRRLGVQTVVQTSDGVLYAPIGGGYATDGSSILVTRDLMNLRDYFRELEQRVLANSRRIDEAAWSAGINPNKLRLRLVLEGDQPFAQDDEGTLRVRLPRFAT